MRPRNSLSVSSLPQTATRGNKRRNYNPGEMAQQSDEDREGDTGGVRIRLVVLSMLLKYVSEWDPSKGNHTRGGYLTGQISGVPDTATKMELSYVTDTYMDHPLLLHVVRISNNKGSRHLVGKTSARSQVTSILCV